MFSVRCHFLPHSSVELSQASVMEVLSCFVVQAAVVCASEVHTVVCDVFVCVSVGVCRACSLSQHFQLFIVSMGVVCMGGGVCRFCLIQIAFAFLLGRQCWVVVHGWVFVASIRD